MEPAGWVDDAGAWRLPEVLTVDRARRVVSWGVAVGLHDAAGAPRPVRPELWAPGAVLPAGWYATVRSEVRTAPPGALRPDGSPAFGPVQARGKPTRVDRGKNLGRRNATNALSQAMRDALGLWRRRQAPAGDRPLPMLVQRLGASRAAELGPDDFAAGVTLQRKLNGVRMVAYPLEEGVELYSRTGESYPGLPQVRGELARLFAARGAAAAARVPPGGPAADAAALLARAGLRLFLDGECYLHGRPLSYISGQTRRGADAGDLEFHAYDCFFPDLPRGEGPPSRVRQACLDLLFAAAGDLRCVRRVQNFPAASMEEARRLVDGFLREGYEGGIARRDGGRYEFGANGYHSAELVKLKPVHDAEFRVVGFTEGRRGRDKGSVIWICEVDSDRQIDPGDTRFTVVPSMPHEQRQRLFRCLSQPAPGGGTVFERFFLGQLLTVKYAELSPKTNKPLQPKGELFRTYEAGPEADPVRAALEACGL